MWTGKGKWHVAMQITTLLQTKTLILCHNVQTLLEMIAKFKAFTNITPWVYYWAKKNIQEVTITTHKSFIELWGQMGDFDVIIYDECDFSLDTNMIQALAKSWAHYLYGMTWTPYKKELNTEDFERIYGKRIVCQTVKKYNIVPESITVYRYKAAEPYIYENWAEQRAAMFNNEERRTYQISLIKKHIQDANAALVISDRVEDTENLFTALQKEGIKVWLINGNTKPKDDKIIIEAIEKKELQVIIGTSGKIARWVDIPIIDTIFMYATVQFEWSIVQAVWRALREHKLKKRVTVIDFSDDECRNQRYQRVKAYQKEYGIPPTSIYIIKPPKHDTNHSLFLN